MLRHLAVRSFVVVAVMATGGVAVAAVDGINSGPAPAPASPVVQFPPPEPPAAALISACGGRTINPGLTTADADRVNELLAERSLHSASLAGNPLTSGTGFQAGVDDALHIQSIDQQLAKMLCPGG